MTSARVLEIEVVDGESGRRWVERHVRSPITIGRNPRNSLHLDAGFVSGWHAEIRLDAAGGAAFVDLGSTNGSTVAGRRLAPGEPVTIGAGLRVALGKIELRLAWVEGLGARAPASSGAHTQESGPVEPATTRALTPASLTGAHSGPQTNPGAGPQSEPQPAHQRAAQAGPEAGPRAGSASAAADPDTPASAGVAEATGFVDLAGVHAAIHALRPAYAELVAAKTGFAERVRATIGGLPESTRPAAMALLRREFPELPGAGELAVAHRAPAPAAATGATTGATTGELARMARALLHAVDPPADTTEASAFAARVVEVLHTAAQAFVEQRAVQSRFGDEMGVRSIREFTPLHAASDARDVLDYLLDWRRGGPERTAQLAGAYGDFMLHQVALINGVVDGVEALLDQLRPEEIERGVGGLSKAAGAWKRYGERYTEIVVERGIATLVFGPEFARAYARIG